MSYRASWGWLLGCVMVGLVVAGWAAPVLGEVVSYTTEVEDYRLEIAYDEVFGDPVPNYNSLVFFPDPTEFCVEAIGADDSAYIDGYFRAAITALDGAAISLVRLWEYGEYTLRGTGTAATTACVDTPIVVMVDEVDGRSLRSSVRFYPTVTYQRPNLEPPLPSKLSGDYDLVDDRGMAVLWVGDSVMNVDEALASAGVLGHATKLTVILDNVLSVESEEHSEARMLKKGFSIEVLIPEPSMLVLLLCGCCALLTRRHR